MKLIVPTRRIDRIIIPVILDREQNSITVRLPIDRADLRGRGPVSVRVTLQQSPDGSLWWPIGSMATDDVAALLAGVDRNGNPNELWGRWTEQLYRADVFDDQRFREWGGFSHELRNADGVGHYYQLAFCERLRVIIETSESLWYGCVADIVKRPAPPVPIGRRSASLLGTFAAAEAASSSVTSGSRTTTSGTLVTAAGGTWYGDASKTVTLSDNKSNTYTEPTSEVQFGSFACVGIAYNMAGTRGTSHTVTNTTNGNAISVGGQEWDGIEASPTVVSGKTTGSGTAVSHSVTVGAASLVILAFGYAGSSKTFAPNGSSSAQEIDENNDTQAVGVYYKVAQTGTPSVAATLSSTDTWGAIAIAFTEATATPVEPKLSSGSRGIERGIERGMMRKWDGLRLFRGGWDGGSRRAKRNRRIAEQMLRKAG